MRTPSLITDLQRDTSKTVSAVSSKQFQSPTPAMSTSILPSANNKQKLADQIKMGSMPSPATISLISSPSPVFSKPKNKSLRALIEAAKSKHVSEEDQLLSSAAALTETKINPGKYASTKKIPKIKKTEESLSTTKNAADSLDANINETSTRDNFWVDSEEDINDLYFNKVLIKSRSGQQSMITLQDVKTTLCRRKATGQSSGTSIASKTETAEELSSKSKLGSNLSEVDVPAKRKLDTICLVTAKSLSDQLPSSSSQHTELLSIKKKALKFEQASLIPVQHEASPQLKPSSPATPLPSGHLSSQVSQAAPLSHTIGTGEGLKVGQHITRLLSASPAPTLFSCPRAFLPAPPARVETLRADEGVAKETLQHSIKKQNTAHSQVKG